MLFSLCKQEHNIDDGPSVRQHQDMTDIPKDEEYKLSVS